MRWSFIRTSERSVSHDRTSYKLYYTFTRRTLTVLRNLVLYINIIPAVDTLNRRRPRICRYIYIIKSKPLVVRIYRSTILVNCRLSFYCGWDTSLLLRCAQNVLVRAWFRIRRLWKTVNTLIGLILYLLHFHDKYVVVLKKSSLSQ